MGHYHYYAHGLDIHSEFACPELPPVNGELHSTKKVQIHLGVVPDSLPGFEATSVRLQVLPQQILFHHEEIASLLVKDGNEIIIQPNGKGQLDEYRQYVVGFGLGAVLHQRGLLVLHSSSVLTEKGAIAFVGKSGAGKSTTAAAFQRRGFTMLSDDLCRVDFDPDGCVQVHPGSVQLKIFADSANVLARDLQNGRRLPLYDDKYAFLIDRTENSFPVPLKMICELSVHEGETFNVEIFEKRKIFRMLLENTYGKRVLRFSGGRELHFDQISKVAGQIKAMRIARPEGDYQLDEILDLIITNLEAV
jgi:hypothetical protein